MVALLDASGVDQTGVISALPTACGLAMIPFIVKPLDELAEVAMDVTFRKVSAPYLESCGCRVGACGKSRNGTTESSGAWRRRTRCNHGVVADGRSIASSSLFIVPSVAPPSV